LFNENHDRNFSKELNKRYFMEKVSFTVWICIKSKHDKIAWIRSIQLVYFYMSFSSSDSITCPDKIARTAAINNAEYGGLNVTDFETSIMSAWLAWITRFVRIRLLELYGVYSSYGPWTAHPVRIREITVRKLHLISGTWNISLLLLEGDIF